MNLKYYNHILFFFRSWRVDFIRQ